MRHQDREWYVDEWACWCYHIGIAWVWIEKRPAYCDRGHYRAGCENVPNIDHQDSFPRYFMDVERAKLEMADWLDWRLKSEAAAVQR